MTPSSNAVVTLRQGLHLLVERLVEFCELLRPHAVLTPVASGHFPPPVWVTTSLHAYLLQRVKIFDDVAGRKHSDELVLQHDRHFIDSVSAHLFHCCPQFCFRIDAI